MSNSPGSSNVDNELYNIIHSHPIDTSRTEPYAHFGGCWNSIPGQKIECTAEPATCTDPSKPFHSGLTHVSSFGALSPTFDREVFCHAHEITTTRCVGAGTFGTCSVGGCGGASTTQNDDANCNLVHDSSKNVATLYGACQESQSKMIKGCFWSERDCSHVPNSQERWLTPDELVSFLQDGDNAAYHPKGYCDCHDVKIGACRTKTGLVCAVDSRQCGKDEAFVTARTMQDLPKVYGTLDCRLCESGKIPAETFTATRKYLATHRNSKNSLSSLDEDIGNPGAATGNKLPASEAGAIAGGVIGGIIGLLLLICVIKCFGPSCGGDGIEKTVVDDDQETGVQMQSSASSEEVPAVEAGVVS